MGGAFFAMLCLAFLVVAHEARRAAAANAPQISDVSIASVGATSSVVTWTTDMHTDSAVNFSEDANYCEVRNAGVDSTDHSVTIPNLKPATTYYFRVVATDDNGDQSFSGNYPFTTTSTVNVPGISKVADTEQAQLAEQAASLVSQITNATALAGLAQVVANQGQQASGAPRIIGDPSLDIGSDQVTITWATDQDADSNVYFATDAEYNRDPANPYPHEDGDGTASTQSHTVTLYGLSPSTLYHYKASSETAVGLTGESGDLTFTTKSLLPEILSPHLVDVGEHNALVSWGTQIPAAGEVDYTDMDTRKSLSVGDPAFLVTHAVQLTNLVFQTRYSMVIKATNQAGDAATSQPIYFVTTKNTTPPVISQVSNDSTLYPGQDTTVQTIISWQTSEPATCTLSYVEGVVKNNKDTITVGPEALPVSKHVSVVTNFSPATVYKYWVTCGDIDGTPRLGRFRIAHAATGEKHH